ncbi:MAG: SDR family NAD(P)-dependent oxidoreductase, partial [Gammaproteobacteria bacterium]|nr:SDR family NAD(P)-dependent oxidoreductase [Gammaproteobacteria bacterium]
MRFDLTGRVALVTGAGRGLGRAIAIRLAESGALCGLTSRTIEELSSVAREIERNGGSATYFASDVSVREEVEACVAHVETQLGPVDILVNNAGVGYLGPIDQMDDADWDRVLRTNLNSVLYFSRRVIPGMRARRGGRIINIASISGQTGGLNSGVNYAASKGGMIAMTKKMARELAPHGVTVNAVAPGQ